MTFAEPFLLGGDLPVRRIGFGAMRLAANGFSGPARDPETSMDVLRRAVELGVDHIDTAAFYVSDDGAVHANELIRSALHPYADGLVIATKVGPRRDREGGVSMASSPSDLRPMVEQNLRELGVDRLDLVYLRVGGGMGPDPTESVAARFEALAALREEGLIAHLGLSNVTGSHLAEARAIAPVAAVQNSFLSHGPSDTGLLDACEVAGIAVVPFFPLGGGIVDITDEDLAEIARHHGATVPQIALAALLESSPRTLAIPGTGSIAHLEENMAAADIRLTVEEINRLT